MQLGSHRYVDTAAAGGWAQAANSVDFMLVTAASLSFDWNAVIGALRPNGKIVLMGLEASNITVSPFALIGKQVRIVRRDGMG